MGRARDSGKKGRLQKAGGGSMDGRGRKEGKEKGRKEDGLINQWIGI